MGSFLEIKNKNLILIGVLGIITSLASCFTLDEESEDDDSHVLMDESGSVLTPIWVADLQEQEGDNVGTFMSPSIYEDLVVTPSTESDDDEWFLLGLNLETGAREWQWNDRLSDGLEWWTSDIGNRQSDNVLVEFENEWNKQLFYAIDLSNGETIWKESRDGFSSSVEPYVVGSHYYVGYFPAENVQRPVFYKGNIKDKFYEQLFTLPLDSLRANNDGRLGGFSDFTYFTPNDGHEYLFIPYFEFQLEDTPYPTLGFLYIGLYDLTGKEWRYDKKKVRENLTGFNSSRPVIYEDRVAVFNFNDEMIAVDLYTGNEIWSVGPGDDWQFEYTLVDDVVVIAPYLGAEPVAMGLDVETGRTLWSMRSGGGASHLNELNGVVYWKDGGNGDLYAVDAKTGEKYWQLDDPDPETDSWWKSDGVAVLPGASGEKGRIFASSHKRMYCLEAVR